MKIFSITSIHNPIVKHWSKLKDDSHYRNEEKSFIIEGLKPVKEALPYIKKLICTESSLALDVPFQEKWVVSDTILKKISSMLSSEGILAEVTMPPMSDLKQSNYILVLDGINDPGNLGTLLRTALALGWDGVYILNNSCDPYNDKAVRAARGAHFRLPMRKGNVADLLQFMQAHHYEGLVADIKGKKPEEFKNSPKRILILGNEAHGASEAIKNACEKVTIPMPGEMESLNVAIAGGILMYELRGKQ